MTVVLEDVLRDLTPRVFRYAVARTGDATSAEDVAQDCLTALVSRWQRHGPPESPEAFVFAIARRRAFRAAVRRRIWLPLEHLMAVRDGRPDPESETITRDGRAHVVAAIRRLPARDREALLLVVAGGLSTARAAETLGISPSALKVRTFRARRRLAALMEDRDGARP
jgi:RNA polymerase sigma-70 factor (ECF subfamily)